MNSPPGPPPPRPQFIELEPPLPLTKCNTGLKLHSTPLGRATATSDYPFRMLRAAAGLRDPTFSFIRVDYMDLRASGLLLSLWTLERPFVLQSTDLREVQINNI